MKTENEKPLKTYQEQEETIAVLEDPGIFEGTCEDWRYKHFSHPEKTIRLATCFSGIGAIEQAFRRLKLKHQIVFAGDIVCSLLFISIDKLRLIAQTLQSFNERRHIPLRECSAVFFHNRCTFFDIAGNAAISIAHGFQQTQGHSLQIRGKTCY